MNRANPPTAFEIFDFTDQQMRSRASAKWATMENHVLPAWLAEMDAALAPEITQRLQTALSDHDAGYPGNSSGLINNFLDFASHRWNWDVQSEDVIVYIDVASAASRIMSHYAGEDRGVIIMPPSYNCFYDWLRNANLTPVEVPLLDVGRDARMDLDGIEEALKAGTKVILLCHPHNPVGRVYSAAELKPLAELAAKYSATVVSDEVHAPLTYKDVEFTPYLTVSDEARATGVALHTATKSWNFAGLKCGLIVRDPQGPWPEHFDIPRMLTESGHWGVLATEVAYGQGHHWIDEVRQHFQNHAELLTSLLQEKLPGVGYQPPEASFLAWLDFRETPAADDPRTFFLEKSDVVLSAGTTFGDAGQGFARLNFGTSTERLNRIIDAMAQALKS